MCVYITSESAGVSLQRERLTFYTVIRNHPSMLKHTASLLPWSLSVMFLIDVLLSPFLAIVFKFEKTPACYGVLTDFHSRDPGGGASLASF